MAVHSEIGRQKYDGGEDDGAIQRRQARCHLYSTHSLVQIKSFCLKDRELQNTKLQINLVL